MTQRTTTGITDVVTKQTAKGDLFKIVTTNGTEYATFNGGMAHQARQLIGRNVLLTYVEKQVQKDGRSFTNLYYEGAEPTNDNPGPMTTATYMPPPQGNQGTANPGYTFTATGNSTSSTDGAVREKRILRQTATKVAAHMLAYLPENEQTPQGLLAVADFLVNYYENGYAGAFANQADPGRDSSSPPLGDDDIPF